MARLCKDFPNQVHDLTSLELEKDIYQLGKNIIPLAQYMPCNETTFCSEYILSTPVLFLEKYNIAIDFDRKELLKAFLFDWIIGNTTRYDEGHNIIKVQDIPCYSERHNRNILVTASSNFILCDFGHVQQHKIWMTKSEIMEQPLNKYFATALPPDFAQASYNWNNQCRLLKVEDLLNYFELLVVQLMNNSKAISNNQLKANIQKRIDMVNIHELSKNPKINLVNITCEGDVVEDCSKW